MVATHIFLEFSPRIFGKMNPFWTIAYFSDGLVQHHQLVFFLDSWCGCMERGPSSWWKTIAPQPAGTFQGFMNAVVVFPSTWRPPVAFQKMVGFPMFSRWFFVSPPVSTFWTSIWLHGFWFWKVMNKNGKKTAQNVSHRIHVWYIYLHLVDFYGKCR